MKYLTIFRFSNYRIESVKAAWGEVGLLLCEKDDGRSIGGSFIAI